MSKDPLAIFTIVQNEPHWLPIWVEFYRSHVDPVHLYVLDHDSTGPGSKTLESLAGEFGIHVIPVHRRTSFDHDWLRETVGRFQTFLFSSYRAVLFAEVDEFVSPTGACPATTLTEYADAILGQKQGRRTTDYVRCTGYEVVHQHDSEPTIDWTRPLLGQRSKWYESTLYSKTLLSLVPLDWTKGFHDLEKKRDRVRNTRDDLLLIHLHKIDFEFCIARHEEALRRKWSQDDLESGAGRQNRLVDREELAQWFAASIDDLTQPAALVDIPAEHRSII
jgi:hypothetical protein